MTMNSHGSSQMTGSSKDKQHINNNAMIMAPRSIEMKTEIIKNALEYDEASVVHDIIYICQGIDGKYIR